MSNEYLDIAMKKVVNQEVLKVLHEIRGEMECIRTKEVSTIANTPIVGDRIGFDVLRDAFRIIDRHIGEVTDNED